MSVRLQANDCIMIVVNGERFAARHQGHTWSDVLFQLTQKLQIPVRIAEFKTHSDAEMHTQLPPFPKLGEVSVRSKLLVAGCDLEESVSLVTLEALAIGFEVFLVADLIPASDERVARFCWDRLVQAGAVPTTITQVSLEIVSNAHTEVTKSEVKKLLTALQKMQP